MHSFSLLRCEVGRVIQTALRCNSTSGNRSRRARMGEFWVWHLDIALPHKQPNEFQRGRRCNGFGSRLCDNLRRWDYYALSWGLQVKVESCLSFIRSIERNHISDKCFWRLGPYKVWERNFLPIVCYRQTSRPPHRPLAILVAVLLRCARLCDSRGLLTGSGGLGRPLRRTLLLHHFLHLWQQGIRRSFGIIFTQYGL